MAIWRQGRSRGDDDRRLTVHAADASGDWRVSHGRHEGRPMVTRVNAALQRAVDRSHYPTQLGVAVPLLAAEADGLPHEDELQDLARIEERLVRLLAGRAVLVGVISTAGMREFVAYTRSDDWVREFFAELQGATATHTVQLVSRSDPKWTVFAFLMRESKRNR